MSNNNDAVAVAATHSVDLVHWHDAFGEVVDLIAPRFARYEPARHAASLTLGMLAGLEKKNCWTIAEHRGQVTPDALQQVGSSARNSA